MVGHCFFPVDDMQCDSCKRWFHKMYINLSPAAHKYSSKPASLWLCKECCMNKLILLNEVSEPLTLIDKVPSDDTRPVILTSHAEITSVIASAVNSVHNLDRKAETSIVNIFKEKRNPVQNIVQSNRNKSFIVKRKKLPPKESALTLNAPDDVNATVQCEDSNTQKTN